MKNLNDYITEARHTNIRNFDPEWCIPFGVLQDVASSTLDKKRQYTILCGDDTYNIKKLSKLNNYQTSTMWYDNKLGWVCDDYTDPDAEPMKLEEWTLAATDLVWIAEK